MPQPYRLSHFLIGLPALNRRALAPPVLLDTFGGSGALTAHAPEICPAGASWAIVNGNFANLSGGVLPYSSGNYGKALIDAGVANFELRWKSKYLTLTGSQEHGGVMLRSNALGSDFYYVDYDYGPASGVLGSIGGQIKISADQPNANFNFRAMTGGQFYEWRLVLYNDQWRLYDENGILYLAGVGAVKTAQTYLGPYNIQGGKPSAWEFISVHPVTKRFTTFSVMGDSISNDPGEWPNIFAVKHNNGYCYAINHAVSGSSIMSQMDGQTDQCEADNADFTLILLGANDGLTNTTAKYQENLQELYGTLHKPIYAIGVIPNSDESYRAAQNGYIQAAVSNARANGVNVTYIDTDSWIDPVTDTSDGLHPNTAGQVKIAGELEQVIA